VGTIIEGRLILDILETCSHTSDQFQCRRNLRRSLKTYDETGQDEPNDDPARPDFFPESLVPGSEESFGSRVSGQQGGRNGARERTDVEDQGLDFGATGVLLVDDQVGESEAG
jgi:hypothetical protein